MGHRDTSAQFGGNGEIFVAGGRFGEAAAAHGDECGTSHAVTPPAAAAGHENHRARGIGAWVLLAMLRLYQIVLSPFLGGACKFYPSCSNYAVEAIQQHGAGRGFVLAMKRLGRCRPFTKGGYDPVPDREMRNANLRGEEPVN